MNISKLYVMIEDVIFFSYKNKILYVVVILVFIYDLF